MTCGVCGSQQIVTYERGDGVRVGKCCIRVGVKVAERHGYARRIHELAHGHPGPGCPVCARDAAIEMIWGDPPRDNLTLGY